MLSISCIHGPGNGRISAYLTRCPNALFYTSPQYLALISRYLQANPGWLIARRDDILVGILPFIVKKGPLGPVYNSLPYFGSNGGVIQSKLDPEAKSLLIHKFYTIAAEAGSVSATLITNPLEQDSKFYFEHSGSDYTDKRIGQITHFPTGLDSEDLINLFQNPRPRNIRRAVNQGISVVRLQDLQAIDFLYRNHQVGMQAIGGVAKTRHFFELVPQNIDSSAWAIYLGLKDSCPVAALLVFYFNRTVEYFTPVIVEKFRNTQALSLVIYTAMQGAIKKGFINWNWGGTWIDQKGVYDFKKRWGTLDYPYYYFTKLFKQKALDQTPAYWLESYAGFYILPFSVLKRT